MAVADLLRDGASALGAAGVPSPDWDAERLLRSVLGCDRAALLGRPDAAVPDEAAARYRALVSQRALRVPLQHLVGTQAFWRHDFLVSPDALVPRPETEGVVEAALARLVSLACPLVVDVGTGCGCIALSLAAERPDAEVHATDVSAAALALARRNARRLGLDERVRLHRGDLLEPVREASGRFDVVVSNPPYVATRERDALAPEVRDHEPATALFAGEDGLAVYRRLVPAAAAVLRPGGWLILELGQGQDQAVRRLCEGAGLAVEATLPDLHGIPRVMVARARSK